MTTEATSKVEKVEKTSREDSHFLPYNLPLKRVKMYLARSSTGAEKSAWRNLLREMQAKKVRKY